MLKGLTVMLQANNPGDALQIDHMTVRANNFVLPPRRPQYNGGVERSNRICKEEFYANKALCTADSVRGIAIQLQLFLHHYNTFRSHKS